MTRLNRRVKPLQAQTVYQQASAVPISQLTLYAPLDAINIRDEGGTSYATLICQGEKTIETRRTNSLRSCVGKRVRIVRTGRKYNKAQVIGEATIGAPIIYETEEQFAKDQARHLVQPDSEFWIKPGEVKHGYPMLQPTLYQTPYPVQSHGIVIRKNQPFPRFPFKSVKLNPSNLSRKDLAN